jgi:hypothetical protein
MVGHGPKTVYETRVIFDAPLAYAFRWCTDYRADDSRRSRETFRRKVLERSARRIVYEDLDDKPTGFVWRRTVVTPRPPGRWTAVSVGNFRVFHLDYRLRALPDGRTEFHLRGVRQATLLGKNPPKAALERELRTMWTNYGRELARDYRASRRGRRS